MNNRTQIPQGYKDSPLGIIPKEWEVKRLGDICDYVDYRGKSPNKSSKGIFLVTAKNIREGYIDYEVSQEFIPIDEFEDTMRRGKAQIGDVLITTEAPLGHVAQIDKSNIALAQRVIKYRAKNGLLNTYLKYYLMSEKFQTILTANATGSTALGIKGSRLHQLPIAFPCIVEQKKILNILNLWDTAIEKQSELIEKLKLRKRALMQQLLTGKKRLPGFSGEWKHVPIKSFANEVSNRNVNGINYIVLSCTKYDGLVPSLEYFGKQIYSNDLSSYKIIPQGHFAYATNHIEEGSIGYQSNYENGLISPMYTVFSTDNKMVDDTFLFAVLKSHHLIYLYQSMMEGSINRRGGLRWDPFSTIKIDLPPLREQKAISAFLKDADKEIELANKKLNNLQSQKRGLMQQLLSGKKRII